MRTERGTGGRAWLLTSGGITAHPQIKPKYRPSNAKSKVLVIFSPPEVFSPEVFSPEVFSKDLLY
jgi:hypothetical protein